MTFSLHRGQEEQERDATKERQKVVIGTKNPTSHRKERHGRDGLVSETLRKQFT